MRYYEESFAEAIAPMDANVSQFMKLLLRKGDPAGEGKPAFTATARRSHSFFGMRPLPDLPADTDVMSEEALSSYVSALERNGFARQLTEATIRAGHWLAQEKPVEVNAALVKWLANAVPDVWPQPK